MVISNIKHSFHGQEIATWDILIMAGELQYRAFHSVLSHNLGRSLGHHRRIRKNPFPSCLAFCIPWRCTKPKHPFIVRKVKHRTFFSSQKSNSIKHFSYDQLSYSSKHFFYDQLSYSSKHFFYDQLSYSSMHFL